MKEPSTRATILRRLGERQDDRAWQAFDERYGSLIRYHCLRRGLTTFDADDVCQTVSMSLLGAFSRGLDYRPERGRFRAYLGRMVRNAIYDHSTSQHQARGLDEATLRTLAAAPVDDDDRVWESDWRDAHLARALGVARRTLSSRDMSILRRLLDGTETARVAVEFDLAPQAVRKVKQRALHLVKSTIQRQVEQEETPFS